MAQEVGLIAECDRANLARFRLQPHRVENFKFSKDPQFVEKVRDIVGLYLNPPDRAIVLCVGRKESGSSVESDVADSAARARRAAYRGSHNDYERHGVTSLFAAMDVAWGVTISTCYRRYRYSRSSSASSMRSKPIFPAASMCIWSWITMALYKVVEGARLAKAASAVPGSFHADQR